MMANSKQNNYREVCIQNGIKNLNQFGYRNVSEEDLLKDYLYASFFKRMLEDSLVEAESRNLTDASYEIRKLIIEVETNLTNSEEF